MKKVFEVCLIAQIAFFVTIVFSLTVANAENVAPSFTVNVTPVERTMEQMKAEEHLEAAYMPRQEQDLGTRYDEPSYSIGKAAADEKRAAKGPGSTGQVDIKNGSKSAGPLAPPTAPFGFAGRSQGGSKPPDTHGAMGDTRYVEVTNTFVDYYKRTGAKIFGTTLASFFGYFTKGMFDPQVMYDTWWDRYIVTAEARPESCTVQRFFIAVSKNMFPFGSWWIYSMDTNLGNSCNFFFDYPHIGQDRDALLFTANIFDPGHVGAYIFAYPKSEMYNGLPTGTNIYTVNTDKIATVMPPNVKDGNSTAYFYGAPQSGNVIRKWRMVNAGRSGEALYTFSTVSVPTYTWPPSADQPGTSAKLDTMDSRFINMGPQIGTSSWQVHTINSGGLNYPVPRWYEFNNVTNTIKQSGYFYRELTSDDWMASIDCHTNGNTAVCWSSTNKSTGKNARVVISGRQPADAAGNMNAAPGGSVGHTSPTYYNGFRWGDYSSINFDPADSSGKTTWSCNERIINSNTWGTWIQKGKFP